jgi:hypothetical protein
MPKGRLYDREGIATMERRNLETHWVERLDCYYLCVFAISNRCSKDSSCAHKGLVTNWSHHSSNGRYSELRRNRLSSAISLRFNGIARSFVSDPGILPPSWIAVTLCGPR